MPTVNSDVLRFLQAGLRTDFNDAYKRSIVELNYPKVASVIETTLPTQDYAMLGGVPTMKKYTPNANSQSDELKKEALKALGTYQITDSTYKAAIVIARRTIEDDQYGVIRPKAVSLAQEAARHKEQLAIQQFALGFTTAGMDSGANFFDTVHNESGTLQSNKFSGALTATSLQNAITAMMVFTDDKGVPLNISPDTLLVGPSNLWNARQLLNSQYVVAAGGGTNTQYGNMNTLQGALNIVVSPYLSGAYANYWFVMDTKRAIRPVILQVRSDVPIEFTASEDPDDPRVQDLEEYTYSVRGRYEVGFGIWQTAFGGIA